MANQNIKVGDWVRYEYPEDYGYTWSAFELCEVTAISGDSIIGRYGLEIPMSWIKEVRRG